MVTPKSTANFKAADDPKSTADFAKADEHDYYLKSWSELLKSTC